MRMGVPLPTWYGLHTSLTPSAAAPAAQRRGVTSLRTQSRPRAPEGQWGPLAKVPVTSRGSSLLRGLTQRPLPQTPRPRGPGRPGRLTAPSGELAPLCVLIKMRKPSPERSGNLPKITQLRCASSERSDNLHKIPLLRGGSPERLGTLGNITQPKVGAQRGPATCL